MSVTTVTVSDLSIAVIRGCALSPENTALVKSLLLRYEPKVDTRSVRVRNGNLEILYKPKAQPWVTWRRHRNEAKRLGKRLRIILGTQMTATTHIFITSPYIPSPN